MRLQSRLFSVAVLVVLLMSFIPQAEVAAQSDYELVSVSGVWTATNGGGSTVTGLNTNEVQWGWSTGYGKSGLLFEGSSGQTFDEGDTFLLGTLTHQNWPVYTPTASGATLQITLEFANPTVSPNPTFTFDFDINETDNSGKCPWFHTPGHPKCDDRITFPDSYGQESFTIGDQYYTLKIEGFVDSYPGGTPVEGFVTEEWKNNSAYLVASLSSVLVQAPDITLTKKTNDLDVASAPGPELVVGESVTWSYIVQNTGNVNLWNVQVTDDQVGSISCPSTSLASGASMTCTASGTVTTGQYHNQATVTARHSSGSVNDSDDSWYVGVEASVDIEKYVWDGSNWLDADSGPGPSLTDDGDVLFKFVVTNTGDVDLTGTELADNYVYSLYTSLDFNSTCFEPDPLVAGDSFTCYGPLGWQEGQHENTAWIGGYYNGEQYTDMDKAHYVGVSPDIDVEKSVLVGSSWVDADSSPGPSIASGSDVLFRFVVKNTGSVALSNLSLSDDKMASLYSDQNLNSPCVAPASLAVDGSFTCYGSLSWAKGQHVNEATATGDYDGESYDDSDKAHYFGVDPSIDVEKFVWDGTTWRDADSATGPYLEDSGSDVEFKFVVTNNGNVELTNIQLSDNLISFLSETRVASSCADVPSLSPGASFTCYGDLSWEEGQHVNEATVTASYGDDDVDDKDKAHYYGIAPEIDVEKEILVGSNWLDADSSPGPSIDDSGDVLFRFTVKNTGNVTLSNISLSDNKMASLYSDQNLTTSCVEPASLAPDASFTCYGGLSWAEGQHKNTASASGIYNDTTYDDDDPAHYFGIAPEIDVEKSVYDGSTWADADSEPGPSIMGSSDVLFQFVVENTGNVALSDVSLSDNKIASLYSDHALTVPCTEPNPFNPDASFTCYGSLSWAEGQHENEATVTGIYGGAEIDDRDKAHYYGTAPEIDVEKEILVGSNWMDADSSPGPSIEDGGDVLFRFTVKNTGSVALSNISLSDDKMASLYSDQNLSSPCVEPASLAPDGSFTCYGSLSWAEGQHVNEATATGDYDGVSYDDIDKAHYFGIDPSIDVEKYIWDGATWQDADTGTGPELWSDPVFMFVVTNDGNLALTNVQLSDSLISSLYLDEDMTTPCTNGITMEPDDSLTCYGTLSWAAGQHENTASVSGSVYGSTVDDTDKAHYFGPNPDIDVEKWVLNGSTWADADSATGPVIGSGSDVLFRFVVSNIGNVALSNVSLSDSVIASLYSDQALTTPCVESAPFGVGETFTCYGSLSWAAGQHQNTASVSGSYDGQPTSDTDLAHYYGATVSIDVEKNVWNGTAWEDADTGDGPTLLDGTDPVFRFVVTNTSNVALTNVQLSDDKISTLYSDEALTAPCVEPASLAVGASFTCYGSLPWASGNHENTATVSAESNGLPANDTDLAHYLGGDPDVGLTKTADVDVFTQVGEIITYTFVAENTGNLTLYDVVISDPLPDLSSLDCSATMPATLTPGSKLTCTATYEVKQGDIDAGAIANTASVEGTDSYQRTVEDDDSVDLEGPKEGGSIVLDKSADPEIFVAVDDVITYTFVATNNGTFTLSNVTIEDPLPDLSALDCTPTQPSELAPGESMTCTATYTITQEDVNAGIVENTATVTGEASNGDEVEDSDDAVVEGPKEEASIHLDKKAEPATYENVGDKITYTFTVTNNGIYTLYDVTVTDPLFSLLYGPIDVFEPGDSMTYKYTYTITQADIDAGNIVNVATAMGYGPDEEPVSSTDEALVDRPKPKEEEEEETLPTTGFAPNQITTLPLQSLDQAYTAYSDFWLEIPSLGIQVDIVGVPETPSGWDVTWLDRNAGWLNGTTFPTWPGNSFVTGHVWDAYDQPGPFVDLNKLQWGDKIIVHLNGSAYTFEVRSKLTVKPDDLSLVEQEEDYSWLNLMTCKEFNEETGVYDYRLIVRTVLVGND